MKFPPNKQTAVPKVQVTLDEKPVPLPAALGRCLPAIRSHLEKLALEKNRILFSMNVNGLPVNLTMGLSIFDTFQSVAGKTIGFSQLGFQLLSVTDDQLRQLIEKTEKLSLLALINEWPVVQESWWRLVPELKDPLLTMSFMPIGIECLPGGKELSQRSVVQHSKDLAEILECLSKVAETSDAFEFSNTLEAKLLPWLRNISNALRRFNSPD